MTYKRTMVKLSPSGFIAAKARAKENKKRLGTFLGIIVERAISRMKPRSKKAK